MAKKEKELVWFGMKVTPETKQTIRKLARRKGVSMKDRKIYPLILKSIWRALANGRFNRYGPASTRNVIFQKLTSLLPTFH